MTDAQARLPELETENVRLKNENAALKGQVEKAEFDRDAAIAALRTPVGSQERADVGTQSDSATEAGSPADVDSSTATVDNAPKPARRGSTK